MLFVIGLCLPACGGSSSPTASTPPPPPQTPQQSATVQAQSNNTFSPANVTIFAGGTVTFSNGGGNHNVVANNGSFRCANGCDGDGMGGSGAPSTGSWSVTITFPNVGNVGYNCEVHIGVGMTGTVTVVAQ